MPAHEPFSPQTDPAFPPANWGGEIRIVEPLCAVFRRRLRDEGLKYTAERARILDAVIAMPGPFTVEALLERLKGGTPRVSKATAYRTVKLLADGGIIQPVPFGRGGTDQIHYTLAYGRGSTATLINPASGQARVIDAPGLEAFCRQLAAQHGLRLDGQSLTVYATP